MLRSMGTSRSGNRQPMSYATRAWCHGFTTSDNGVLSFLILPDTQNLCHFSGLGVIRHLM